MSSQPSTPLRATEPHQTSAPRGVTPYPGMVWMPSGTFRIGSETHYPAPCSPVLVHTPISYVGFRYIVRPAR